MMNALYIAGGIFLYCILGTVTIAVMTAEKQFTGAGDGMEPMAFLLWPFLWIISLFALIFGGIFEFTKWCMTPRKAEPTAPPSLPVDVSTVKPLPDPATMPEEFKGKRIDTKA